MPSPIFAPATARPTPRRYAGAAVFAALLGALALPCTATEPPLTLARATHLALERNRQLAAQDSAAAAFRDMAVAAGQLPDPILKLGVDNLPTSGADRFSLGGDFMTMRRVGVMQELTGADKLRLRAGRFEREAEKSLVEKDAAAAGIERDTALAWLERYYAEATAALIAEQGAQAALEIQAAEGAYRGARGSQADLLAARAALGAIEDRASDARRRVRAANTMLARWIGPAANLPLAGAGANDTIRLERGAPDSALAHHPQVAVLAKREEIAQAEAQLARANQKADWSIELTYQQRGPGYANMVSVGLSIPLQWDRKNRQDRELSARLATLEQARAEREEAVRAHGAETRTMLDAWDNGRERIGRYRRDLLPLAAERTAATLAAYRGGRAALAEVLAARRGELELRIQALQLEADTARLWAQLNYLYPDEAARAQPSASKHGSAQ
ncbi:TolC family protein [Janthinobacterium sp.]|uniref:TolC family protein n=1 Tax=Janthinobacterium sp. TaxID=1871054 RepID=UPI00293D9F78|nr:TolC family protein [Janthinobacterium sp.]